MRCVRKNGQGVSSPLLRPGWGSRYSPRGCGGVKGLGAGRVELQGVADATGGKEKVATTYSEYYIYDQRANRNEPVDLTGGQVSREGNELGDSSGKTVPQCNPPMKFDRQLDPWDPSLSEHGGGPAKPPSCCAPRPSREVTSLLIPTIAAPKRSPDSYRATVSLPGGTFLMGTDYAQGFPADGEGPIRAVELSPFAIDTCPVTNADFAAFVQDTHYRTEAETFGWSFVFWSHIPESRFEAVVEDTVAQTPWWCKVPGAMWNRPEGPDSNVEGRANHPVVHVSWNDDSAYANWALKRLPTEAQWEYAARGGLEQKLYPWGDDLTPEGKHLCNIWQGQFPVEDTGDDGFAGTSPVDAFPPNSYGIWSATGNVWEWCADWFDGGPPAERMRRDPAGPAHGDTKVMKGGSFLCHESYCNRYRVAARTSNTPDSSASNIGFRCAGTSRS